MKKFIYTTIVLVFAFIMLPYALKAQGSTGAGVSGNTGTTFSVQGVGGDDDDEIGDDRGGDNGEKDDDSRSQDSQKNESDDDDDDSLVLPPVSVSTEANLKEAVKNVSDDELKKIGIERAMEVQATTSATGTPVKPNLEIHGLGRDAIEHLSDDARKVLESLDIKPEAISTSNDLKLFISSKIAKNSKIEAVDTTETQTEVDYTSQAKVLGFIPVHMKSKIVLDANGNVVVKMPWYRGLVSKKWKLSGDTVKAQLDQAGLTAEQQVQLQLSLEARAKAIETISELLKKMDETASGIVQNLK